MSDRKENYSQFFNQLCDEINKYTSFKVYISIRYSNKILNDLWNKYIKNGIEIPNNLLNLLYPNDTKNHLDARRNISKAVSSVKSQKMLAVELVNRLHQKYHKKSFESNDNNTIIFNGGAFLNIKEGREDHTNIRKWKNKLLYYTGGGIHVIKPYDKNKQLVLLIFADVDRYFRDVKSGIDVAKTLTGRGIVLVFLGNHLIINKNDITNKSMRFNIFEKYLEMAQSSSKEKSNKMIQRNEAKRRQKRKSPSVSGDNYRLSNEKNNHKKLCTSFNNMKLNHEETKTSSSSYSNKECSLTKYDFDKFPNYANDEGFCNNCRKHIGAHPYAKNFLSFFWR